MHNLVYLSAASYLFSENELIDILNISRLNNERINVTGMLLYSEGSIIQILEGEKEVLFTLFNKIKKDSRHTGVIKMLDKEVTERSFGDWSMGFRQISKKNWSAIDGQFNLSNKSELNRHAGSGSSDILTIIKSFAFVNMPHI